jgi:uncharacterized lipoprotein
MLMVHSYKLKLAAAAMLLALLAGCTSPEASRQRGDGYGTGADPDNHPSAAEIDPCSKVFTERCNP